MSLLDIRVLGDPVLRAETAPVPAVTDELRRFIDDMFETMHAAQGIGPRFFGPQKRFLISRGKK